MSIDRTEPQSSESQRRAKQLSLKSTTPPGEVPGYKIESFLGSGAFGQVWVAIDQNNGRRVAIKFYTHRSGLDWTLLSREVEKLVVLSADRYVVQLLNVGWDAEPPYYVMDYIENGSLEQLLASRGPLPLDEAVDIFREVCFGLMHLHSKGVLHCDLKPANVLLDEDRKPRLADFGQARLSHEQSPALGTLFYMAPEQANLQAVPDARWDVYALGALLYCMLTGEPPYRSDGLIKQIESATDLAGRLERYQAAIMTAPRPTGHRQTPGIDRALVDIIDRCLDPKPGRRFPSVQSVVEALEARDLARSRRPLVALGVLAPMLVLLVVGLFALRGYNSATRDSTQAVLRRAYEAIQFSAKAAARSIEAEIPRYFAAVEDESGRDQLAQLLDAWRTDTLLQQLVDASRSDEERAAARRQLLQDERQHRLKRYLAERLEWYKARWRHNRRELKFASMFVTDPRGTILAVAYQSPSEKSRSEGKNFAWRTYYHGGPGDLPRDTPLERIRPISRTHLSAVFHSTTTRTWKVAVSTPVADPSAPDTPLGILVLTIELGDFGPFRDHQNRRTDHFAVLVDARQGPSRGTILHHPFFAEPDPEKRRTEVDYRQEKYRVPLPESNSELPEQFRTNYVDPLSRAPGGQLYAGRWLAAVDWVRLPASQNGRAKPGQRREDLAVIVQENYDAAIAPIHQLGSRLVREGLLALGAVLLVVCGIWLMVARMLRRQPGLLGRHLSGSRTTPSVHTMETVAAPQRHRP